MRGGGRKGLDLPGGASWGCLGAVRASREAKKSENKTVCVFFQGAFDGNAPGPQNTSQKSKNIEKLDL